MRSPPFLFPTVRLRTLGRGQFGRDEAGIPRAESTRVVVVSMRTAGDVGVGSSGVGILSRELWQPATRARAATARNRRTDTMSLQSRQSELVRAIDLMAGSPGRDGAARDGTLYGITDT